MEEAGDRKAEHIALALERRMQLDGRFFDNLRFEHVALPELALEDVDLATEFLERPLRAPLLISCMTGGTDAASAINRNLAIAAQECGVALGVGSQRKALEDPSQAHTFQVRDHAPRVPLLANLGAVQLNYGMDIEHCRSAVSMIDADALVLHLNPLQEAIQPEGQTDFRNLAARIGEIAAQLGVPVIVKEIGCGISGPVARRLLEQGIRIVDVAGLGGTSWARIESARARDETLGARFGDWGVPTPRAIREAAAVEGLTVIGSGGLRSGVDVAKAIALGADLAGLAHPFLEPATRSAEAVVEAIEQVLTELRIAMFCVGARTVDELKRVDLEACGRNSS